MIRLFGPCTSIQITTLATILALFCALSATAAEIHVNAEGTGDYPDIQSALYGAASGDHIILADGVYTGPGNRRLEFARNVTLRSASYYANCIIDLQGSDADPHYGFALTEETGGTIQGITIKNAYWSYGAVAQTGWGAYIFEDCFFQDNHATEKGGVWYGTDGTNINFRNCGFVRNTAGTAGGCLSGGSDTGSTVQGCTFALNGAPQGGAIYIEEGAICDVDYSILSWGFQGSAVEEYYSGGFQISCTNIFGNRDGNWVNGASGNGTDGNTSVDPLLMDPMAAEPNLWLSQYSPMAAGVNDCGQVGAFPRVMIPESVYAVNAQGTGMFASIDEALDSLPDGTEVVLEDGTYTGYYNTYISDYGKSVNLRSRSGDPTACVIDLTDAPTTAIGIYETTLPSSLQGITLENHLNLNSTISVNGSPGLSLEDCIFQNGDFSFEYSTIFWEGSGSISMTGCIFRDNTSHSSGPVLSALDEEATFGNEVVISHCQFENNAASWASGVMEVRGFEVTLATCLVLDNNGSIDWNEGATILVVGGEILVDNCYFEGNQAYRGGGLAVYGCDGLIRNTTFRANNADKASALDIHAGNVDVTDCTFYANHTNHSMGAAHVTTGGSADSGDIYHNVRFDNCAFIRNTSNGFTAALDLDATNLAGFGGDSFSYLNVELYQCTFHANESIGEPNPNRSQIYGHESSMFSRQDLELDLDYCLITGGINCQALNLTEVTSLGMLSNDIHGNSGGNYTDEMIPFFDDDGNMSVHPLYCDPSSHNLVLNQQSLCTAENNEFALRIGAFDIGCYGLTDAPEGEGLPRVTRIEGNYPNPFNPRTTIKYAVATGGPVTLWVHDIAGRKVRTLVDGQEMAAGQYQAVWNGCDDQGRTLGAGVYLARLVSDGQITTHKLVMLK